MRRTTLAQSGFVPAPLLAVVAMEIKRAFSASTVQELPAIVADIVMLNAKRVSLKTPSL